MNPPRLSCLPLLLAGLCLMLARSPGLAQPRPNIVLLLADDLGYGDIGCYGETEVRTPQLDQLARQGTRFTQFYANGPECTPTRTALLTGRYQQRLGGLECAIGVGNVGRYDDAIRLAQARDLGLPADESVLPAALRKVGYECVLFGKWHLGYEAKFHPSRHGFEQFFGILGGNADYFRHREDSPLPVLYRNEQPIEQDGYLTHLFVDEAVRFLRKRGKATRPFFLYLPFTTPHSPYQGPNDADVPANAPIVVQGNRAKYREMIEDLDLQVGRVLAALQELRLADNTLVVFTSDNGGTRLARNAPFSGQKSSVLEGGIRVPLILRWPGRLPADSASRQVGVTFDLTRSFVELSGGTPLNDRPLEGLDLIGWLMAGEPETSRTLFWRIRRGHRVERAVRDGDWKYVHRRLENGQLDERMFNLENDVGERQDLLAAQPQQSQRLRQLLADWEQQTH